jgi:serine/threonine-protein kinase
VSGIPDRLTAALADRYRIERELGAGGMATVYLAEDIKHDRKVALKVLKPELAAVLGADRFVVEIKTTAALQHPHILPLFDSGTADGFLFYVMPFIDGETLRSKLDRETQLGIDESVKMATNVADALDYAHRHGVIHRDIKPENILLHEGRPMVADFGIALAVSAAAGGRMTETGLSLGTPHYMSPEQATAEKDIGARSDIYSLASVLYEMLTGSPPHVGASAQQIIMKIVTEEAAPVTKLRKSVPRNVAAAVGKALEKLPADRFASAAEFATALQNPAFQAGSGTRAPTGLPTSPLSRYAVPVLLGLTVLFAVLAGWSLMRPATLVDPEPVRFTIPVPAGHLMYEEETPTLAISPDGGTLVYATAGMLYRRSLHRDAAEPLPGTELAFAPLFSPDGQSIVFSQGRSMFRMPINGGPTTRIATAATFGADWAEDGSLITTTRGALWRIKMTGGAPEQITKLGKNEIEHAWPHLVHGTSVLIFTILGNSGLWADARVVALDLNSGRRAIVREQATFGRFVPPNHVVYADGNGTISAIRFDPKRLETVGDPFPVESGVRVSSWGGAASFVVARVGTIAFVRGSTLKSNLTLWVDRSGRRQEIGAPLTNATLALSPDGRRILTDPFLSSSLDIWLMDAVTGERDRITFAAPGTVSYESPVWAPDAQHFAYAFEQRDSMRVHTRSLDGDDRFVFALENHSHLQDWSEDGAWLLVQEEHPERDSDLIAVRLDSVQRRIVVAQTHASENSGRFSPDGRWIAYESDESGRDEVYVVEFPGVDARRQVSIEGGQLPRWSQTSGELFYWRDSTLMSVRVSTTGGFRREAPVPLFTMADADPSYSRWDAASDGKRFLIAAANPAAPAREIHVVLNWAAALRPKRNE